MGKGPPCCLACLLRCAPDRENPVQMPVVKPAKMLRVGVTVGSSEHVFANVRRFPSVMSIGRAISPHCETVGRIQHQFRLYGGHWWGSVFSHTVAPIRRRLPWCSVAVDRERVPPGADQCIRKASLREVAHTLSSGDRSR